MLPDADPNAARLHVIVARARRRAVVFRRGPSKRVRLLVWELGSDTLAPGQWFKGRIYHHRCDLSPDGELLAYFAASFRKPFYSWTALSRPPCLTALALWPKGDIWGGGGLFARPGLLQLNHRPAPKAHGPEEFALAAGYALPRWLSVQPLGEHAGWGENLEIEHVRLRRDGWTIEAAQARRGGGRYGWVFDPAMRFTRPLGRLATLETLLHAIHERGGRWDVRTAAVLLNGARRELGRVDWADMDPCGDVLFAADGRLFRLPAARLDAGLAGARMVADVTAMEFEPVPPSAEALRWPR